MAQLGANSSSVVRVELYDKTKHHGHIAEIGEDSFVISGAKPDARGRSSGIVINTTALTRIQLRGLKLRPGSQGSNLVDSPMRVIPLTRHQAAFVDDEDYAALVRWKWHCSSHGYAVRTPGGREGEPHNNFHAPADHKRA